MWSTVVAIRAEVLALVVGQVADPEVAVVVAVVTGMLTVELMWLLMIEFVDLGASETGASIAH